MASSDASTSARNCSGRAVSTGAAAAAAAVAPPGCTATAGRVDVALLTRHLTDGGATVITPGQPRYDAARSVWNGAIDQWPCCIVECWSTGQVSGAVQTCVQHGVAATVRGGGHSVAGLSVQTGAVLIDVCANGVTLAADGRTVVVEGGATWADVDAVTAKAGLYVPAGLISHTGVAGLTLGGGIGWLSRTRGLTIDSLVAARVVTCRGEVLVASAESNQELFWALRGGGAGLGVVTEFTFRAHPVAAVRLLECHFPADRTAEILEECGKLCTTTADRTSLYVFATVETITVLATAMPPADDDTSNVLDAIVAWGPASKMVSTCTLAELNRRYDEGNRHGRGYRWSRSSFLPYGGLTAKVADDIARFILKCPSNVTVQVSQLGGAIATVDAEETAFQHRTAGFECHALAVWDTHDPPAEAVSAVQRFTYNLSDGATTTPGYVNIMAGESVEWMRAAFGDATYTRLVALKRKLDPHNFFASSPLGRVMEPGPWHVIEANEAPASPQTVAGNPPLHRAVVPEGAAASALPPPKPPLPPPPAAASAGIHASFRGVARAMTKPFEGLGSAIARRISTGLRPTKKLEISRPSSGAQRMFICNACMQMIAEDDPPFGTATLRYHCSECSGFDLCEKCYSEVEHPHYMWKEVSQLSRADRGTTTAALLLAAMQDFRHRWCCGTLHDDEWRWKTFGDVRDRVHGVVRGLKGLAGFKSRSRIGICGANSEDWLVVDLALLVANCMSVPLDLSASMADLKSTIEYAELTAVICSAACATLIFEVAAECPLLSVAVIGSFGEAPHTTQRVVENLPRHIETFTLTDIENKGRRLDGSTYTEASPADVLTVIFSSGSTGRPKGIQLSDATLRKRISSVHFPPDPCVIVAYMPLCHSFERMQILNHFVTGGRVAFHPGSASEVLESCQQVRPTSFSSTPRLWNVLYQDFLTAVREPGTSRAIVLERFRGVLGGRTRHIGTGGAYTRPEVVDFLRECFQCSVVDGFGTTETGGLLWDGQPGSTVRTLLVDCPELGYLTTDVPFPRGELCVSSDNMSTEGYLGDPDSTKAAFFTDDKKVLWYRTGDICALRRQGKYDIVDRKKSVFKLAHGKFVAPQRLEQLYETAPLIEQCWVTAEPWAEFTVAVIVVNYAAAAATIGAPGLDEEACAPGGQLESAVLAVIAHCSERDGVPTFQWPRGVILELTPWTVEAGILTGTNKIRRPLLEQRYKHKVQKLYSQLTQESRTTPVGGVAVRITDRIRAILAAEASVDPKDISEDTLVSALLPDSLVALRAIGVLNRHFTTNLRVAVLLEAQATISSVARVFSVDAAGGLGHSRLSAAFFESEARGADVMTPPQGDVGDVPPAVPHDALLTGATGFVGVYLLIEMLRQLPGDSNVHCLIRAPTEKVATDRLAAQLASFGLLDTADGLSWRTRVHTIPGDLGKRALGMDDVTWEMLAASIDLIVHCGAHVNSLLPYSALCDANVGGTREVLRLACCLPAQQCFVLYVSTVGVLSPGLLPLPETDSVPADHLVRANGYSQTKWVAEAMVRRAFDRGVSGCVVRPATVFCDSKTGAYNATDFVVRCLRGMALLGAAPQLQENIRVDATPVDELARVVVALCNAEDRRLAVHGRTLNVTSGSRPMAWLVKQLAEFHGGSIKLVPLNDWHDVLQASMEPGAIARPNPLHPLADFFRGGGFPGAITTSTAEAAHVVKACGVVAPARVTPAMVEKFLKRLVAAAV